MFNLTYILVVALHKIKTWLFVSDIYKNKAAEDKRKRTNRFCQLVLFVWMQQQPIFPNRDQLSIFGASELNFCVRNENRWDLSAIVTTMDI